MEEKEIIKDIVLVGDVYVEDNWYGQRYRVILRPTIDSFFKNKTEMKKYEGKVRKYIKGKYKTSGETYMGDYGKLIDYWYVSMGPSIYYHRTELTIEELLELLNKK